MADEIKSVILDVQLDTGDSATKAAALRDAILQLKEAQKANKRETQEQKELYEATDASIKSHTERLALLTQGIKNQETAVKSNNGSFNQLQASLKVGEANLKALTGTMQKNADGTITLTKEYFDQKKQVDEARQALLLFNAGIAQGNLNVGNYDNTLTGMRQKLQDMQTVLANTNVNDVYFNQLQEDIQKTSTEVQILEGKIDSAGQRIAKNSIKDNFNDMRGAAQALTGAVGILSIGLDGDSKAGQLLQKTMIALTVAQTALTIAEQKDDLVKTALAIKTKIVTAAQWAFNSALRAFTVVGALTGIAILIARLSQLKKNTDDNTQSMQDYYAQLDKAQQMNDKFADTLVGVNREYKRELELAEARGESDEKILGLKKKIIDDEIENIEIATRGNITIAKGIELEERKKDLLNERNILDIKYYQDHLKNAEAEYERLKETVTGVREYSDIQEHNIELLKAYQPLFEALYGKAGKEAIDEVIGGGSGQSADGLVGVAENQAIINGLLDQEYQKRLDALTLLERQKDAAMAFTDIVATTFQSIYAKSEDEQQKFYRKSLVMLLEYLEKFVDAQLTALIAKEIAEKSFLGVATSVVLGGIIKASFRAAESELSSFYEGGYTGKGNPKEESTKLGRKNYIYHKDEYVVPSKVVNDPQGAELVEKLERMRVNNPFRLNIPGKADGGFASNFSKSIAMQQGLTAADIAKIKLFVSITDIQQGLKNVQVSDGISQL